MIRELKAILGLAPDPELIQIEVCGICNANCEFCNHQLLPADEKIMMDTDLLKKVIREAISLNPRQISFHVYGESILHPDLIENLPKDYPIVLSTNALGLTEAKAKKLAKMKNLTMILGLLWSEPAKVREKSIAHAKMYLDLKPRNRLVSVQMVCSEHSVPHAVEMYKTFAPYLFTLPKLELFYKQPYMREPGDGIKGIIPNIPKHPRITVDTMVTPRACGNDCHTSAVNPNTTLVVKCNGDIKMCSMRFLNRNLGNANDTTLREAWESPERESIVCEWQDGDKDNKLGCNVCMHMAEVKQCSTE